MYTRKLRTNAALVWVFLFCLTQLSGCSFLGRTISRPDGPPNVNVDVSKIPDAVPKVEKLSKYGNSDYTIEGHRYHVLSTAKGYKKIGYASWYGTKFHGRYTSTNERYNVFSMTAASPELPLPTYVRVTNLSNKQSVIVKVNDRGPFRCNRILDLSYVAAKKLGYAGSGTAKVMVEALDPCTWNLPPQPSHNKHVHSKHAHLAHGLYLQTGAYSKLNSAQKEAEKIQSITNKTVQIVHKSGLYRVQIGPFATHSDCEKAKRALKAKGVLHLLVVKEN